MAGAEAPVLACSVRGCGRALARAERTWRCEQGHSFDVARSGYVNLLQPHDRRSLAAGDSRETVAARRALLDSGFGAALRGALLATVDTLELPRGARVVDLGCGDGHFLAAVCERRGFAGWGVDLSAHAVESAARRHPEHAWIAANADRRLPFVDGAFDLALSIDGRRPRDEFARVLAPNGRLLVAVPAANDLIELRGSVLGEAHAIEGAQRVEAELALRFRLVSRGEAAESRELDRVGLAQLAAATYRCARRSEQQRLEGIERLVVTTAHSVLLFAPSAS